MEIHDLNVKAHIDGVDEAAEKAVELARKISEAKTLAGELASLIGRLEVKAEF